MPRPAFTVASVVSLSLCVAAFVMWAWSDDARSAVRVNWGGQAYAVFSQRGRVGIDNTPAIDDFVREQQRTISQAMDQQQKLMEYLLRTGGREDSRISSFAPNPKWAAAVGTMPPAYARHAIPFWLIIVVTLILPGIWLAGYRRGLVRMSRGFCASCGYNLMGNTSGICPECGRKCRGVGAAR